MNVRCSYHFVATVAVYVMNNELSKTKQTAKSLESAKPDSCTEKSYLGSVDTFCTLTIVGNE